MTATSAAHGLTLAGWPCPACRVFNGEEKEARDRCRCCDAPRPACSDPAAAELAALRIEAAALRAQVAGLELQVASANVALHAAEQAFLALPDHVETPRFRARRDAYLVALGVLERVGAE